MQLLNEIQSKNTNNNNQKQSPTKNNNSNIINFNSDNNNNLLNNEWKNEQDYKRQIIALQIQNEKYRNQLYQLGQTVNKILDKVKMSSNNTKSYPHTPNLQQQLQLTKKQLQNVTKFIQIYQKQLSSISNKKKKDQLQNMSTIQQLLKNKTDELTLLKKQVRELSHKNKGLQYKLLEYSKKNKIKSVDQQALQLKELLNQNKNLKSKLEELQILQQKKSKWLENNIQSAKELQKKVQDQESKLPRIQSRSKFIQEQNQRHSASLPKLQSQKKIYTKWLQSASVSKKNNQLDKELQDLQKINKMVQDKIKNTTKQIKQIQEQIVKIKQRVEQSQNEQKQTVITNSQNNKQSHRNIKALSSHHKQSSKSQINEEISLKIKKKHVGTMVQKKTRKLRKDWVGKFDGIRFSDNRYIRQESRLYKIQFNSMGFCQFFYYSTKDPKKRVNSKLPFDTVNLVNPGKQSTFTVEHPDYIKNIRLKLNVKTHRVTQITLISNLGIQGQFQVDTSLHNLQDKTSNNKKAANSKQSKQQLQAEVNYEMDVKSNQAITYIFGSYGVKLDDKKNITHVWLEGFGVEIIEDFVEELI